MSRTRLGARIEHGEIQWGAKFDGTDLVNAHPSIRNAYERQDKVRVRTRYGQEITGRVTTTTGWKPAFMLLRRDNARGSSDLLGPDDVVVAIKRGRVYVPC